MSGVLANMRTRIQMDTRCAVLRSLRPIEDALCRWGDIAGPPTAGVQVGERGSLSKVCSFGSTHERHGAA
jgi:hypothetical protein